MKIEDIFEYLVGGVTKPAQTRIKQVIRGDGSIVYIPQHKYMWFWCDFHDYGFSSLFRHTNPWTYSFFEDAPDIEKAKREIDKYLWAFKDNKAARERKRLREQEKEVTYIKYP